VSLLKSTDTMSSRAHVPSAHVGLEAYIGVSASGHGAEAQVELLRSQVSLLRTRTSSRQSTRISSSSTSTEVALLIFREKLVDSNLQ